MPKKGNVELPDRVKIWRNLRLNWDEEWLVVATDIAKRSSCWLYHTGAVIVKNNRILSTGYNGRAPGFKKNCLEDMCEKVRRGVSGKNTRTCLGSHAETNALLQPTADKEGAILYSVYSPCYSCAKQIAAAKIAEVVYCKKYVDEFKDVQKYFRRVGIRMRQLKLDNEKLKRGTDYILEDEEL